MIDDLEDLLEAAVVEVFGTMIGLQVQLEPAGVQFPFARAPVRGGDHVATGEPDLSNCRR
jgi:hypothetical protein